MELVDNVTNINVADGAGASGSAGSLLPPVTKSLHGGGKLVSFKLDKWGFKDDVAKVGSVAGRGGGRHLRRLAPVHHTTSAINVACRTRCLVILQCRTALTYYTQRRLCVDRLVMQGIQDAFVTISLVDGKGNVIGQPQDTPTTNNLAGNYVLFNCQVKMLILGLIQPFPETDPIRSGVW